MHTLSLCLSEFAKVRRFRGGNTTVHGSLSRLTSHGGDTSAIHRWWKMSTIGILRSSDAHVDFSSDANATRNIIRTSFDGQKHDWCSPFISRTSTLMTDFEHDEKHGSDGSSVNYSRTG